MMSTNMFFIYSPPYGWTYVCIEDICYAEVVFAKGLESTILGLFVQNVFVQLPGCTHMNEKLFAMTDF